MSEFLEYAIRGIPIGCVFALLAVGLVLTFKTSGVFNLAFAAQAYASAAVFYVTRKEHEWPLLPAAFLLDLHRRARDRASSSTAGSTGTNGRPARWRS